MHRVSPLVSALARAGLAFVCLLAAGSAASAPARMGADLTGLKVMAMNVETGEQVAIGVVSAGAFSGRMPVTEKTFYRLFAVCPAAYSECPSFKMDQAALDGRPFSGRKPGGFLFQAENAQRAAVITGKVSLDAQPPPVQGKVIVVPSWDRTASPERQQDMLFTADQERWAESVQEDGRQKITVEVNCIVGQKGVLDSCYNRKSGGVPSVLRSILASMRHAPVLSNGKPAQGMPVTVRFVTYF